MSSYFDDADTILRGLFAVDPDMKAPALFWRDYHAWENKIVEDCIKACRAKKFPQELRAKIFLAVMRERVFKSSAKGATMNDVNTQALLSMRTSFLSSRLHSLFHEVATWGAKNEVRHLNDDPAWIAKRAPLEKGLSR